ncbi:lauroyl-Kdo(2)-lipid IV(A) myristoyltransferase [Ferrimonas marina]|uniref:Lipid A biosynthesis acyltransferase n=1 Tax=Ferrimonas marina TaxID=299255 RepID=A0A1M5QYV9_9GAMM|nr:lauroyl-Kdo(2)-lipid IV(A) myristoyltransferase [Ferrimonas marina]SHH18980.1 lauroyl-KDO2-lipid IV(A) myristoyltransferase [Ferrimonas marina]
MSSAFDDHHRPHFQWRFLHPKNWGLWAALLLGLFMAFWPRKLRDALAGALGRSVGRVAKGARHRARVNLNLCFPQWSPEQTEQVLDEMFERASQVMFATGILAVRSPRYLQKVIKLRGEEHLSAVLDAGEPVILMVPHSWAIEFPGVLLASRGHRWTTMMNPNKNPMLDWMMLLGRNRFQGKLFTRKHGIKALLNAVRHEHIAYYLPDQDHGPSRSEFVPFFATDKATLPALGRMVEATGAKVIPMYATYDPKQGVFEGHIRPAMTGLDPNDPHQDALALSQELEQMIAPHPEQYMWILKLLRSRPDGAPEPYQKP